MSQWTEHTIAEAAFAFVLHAPEACTDQGELEELFPSLIEVLELFMLDGAGRSEIVDYVRSEWPD